MEIVILYIIVVIVMLIGLIGTIVPALPGNAIILFGAVIYIAFSGFLLPTWVLTSLIAITIIAYFLDYIAGVYGAKKMGASNMGVIGSIFGGIIGFMSGSIVGIILGVFLGTIVGEIIHEGSFKKHSLRAGWGSVLGFLGGSIMKFMLGILMIGIFIFSLL